MVMSVRPVNGWILRMAASPIALTFCRSSSAFSSLMSLDPTELTPGRGIVFSWRI